MKPQIKPIPGYDHYYADTDGNIWSDNPCPRLPKFRQLQSRLDHRGYVQVRPYRDGRRVTKLAHALVALAFHGPRPLGKEVRHLDGTKTNNRPENLAWGTPQENAIDRDRHGRTQLGAKHWQSKLTESDVVTIRQRLSQGTTARDIAREYGLDDGTILSIRHKKTWKHVPD